MKRKNKTIHSQPPATAAAQPKKSVLLPILKAGNHPPVDHAELLERIAKLDTHELTLIKAVVDSREREFGSSTPAEELIEILLLKYAAWGRLTPKDVALFVEEFQWKFECMVKGATAFIKAHPDLFQDLCAELAGTAPVTPVASAAV